MGAEIQELFKTVMDHEELNFKDNSTYSLS